jgi:hypothetical protein
MNAAANTIAYDEHQAFQSFQIEPWIRDGLISLFCVLLQRLRHDAFERRRRRVHIPRQREFKSKVDAKPANPLQAGQKKGATAVFDVDPSSARSCTE